MPLLVSPSVWPRCCRMAYTSAYTVSLGGGVTQLRRVLFSLGVQIVLRATPKRYGRATNGDRNFGIMCPARWHFWYMSYLLSG